MTTGLSWEEMTLSELRVAKEKTQHHEQELQRWQTYAQALETALELRKQLRSIPVNGHQTIEQDQFLQISIRESLKEIGARNQGIIVAKDAVRILTEAGVFLNIKSARGTVYSVLRRSKDFTKQRPGIYLLAASQPVKMALVPNNVTRSVTRA